LRAMAEHNINIAELFAYDPEMLSAAQHEEWFAANSEPRAGKAYEPLREIEETMTRLIRGGDLRRIPRPVGA
ncbi:MAG TPA: hypothetical protein VFR12_12075, partial [Pyrinomonadaceae bacterium]|nr:hypothetical protein [Pyrinomonadaceae bacterium]